MLSPKQAIKAKCRECIYDPIGGNGTWTEQIEACTSPGCPLFELRPVTLKTRQERDKKYLASLSPTEREKVEIRRANSGKALVELANKGIK